MVLRLAEEWIDAEWNNDGVSTSDWHRPGFRRSYVAAPCERLEVWQRAMDLMVEAYRLAARLPYYERNGLADQLRRASASVPANIAEGNARSHRLEYLHFLSIARGSLAEVFTHLESTRRLGFLTRSDLAKASQLTNRVRQMLTRLIASLSRQGATE
jgi:four helix bundle protein